MSMDKYSFKRHSHVLNIFLNHGILGILELVFGIYILFMDDMPKILFFIMIFVDIAYITLVIIKNNILWEIDDEVIKDNERKCGDCTLKFLFISLLIACVPFVFATIKINIAASFCFVVSYGNFLYFAVYAIIAYRQKKLSSDIGDDFPPREETLEEAKK